MMYNRIQWQDEIKYKREMEEMEKRITQNVLEKIRIQLENNIPKEIGKTIDKLLK